jgi:hypothetical protein
MEPPGNRPADLRFLKKPGPQSGKRVPIVGVVFGPSRSGKFRLPDRLSRDSWSRLFGLSTFARARPSGSPLCARRGCGSASRR